MAAIEIRFAVLFDPKRQRWDEISRLLLARQKAVLADRGLAGLARVAALPQKQAETPTVTVGFPAGWEPAGFHQLQDLVLGAGQLNWCREIQVSGLAPAWQDELAAHVAGLATPENGLTAQLLFPDIVAIRRPAPGLPSPEGAGPLLGARTAPRRPGSLTRRLTGPLLALWALADLAQGAGWLLPATTPDLVQVAMGGGFILAGLALGGAALLLARRHRRTIAVYALGLLLDVNVRLLAGAGAAVLWIGLGLLVLLALFVVRARGDLG